jgi:sulfoacetaldehyde dehydrogenase
VSGTAREIVAGLIDRARAAQPIADGWTQTQADEAAVAAAWALVEPSRNRELAELAVRVTGRGKVDDKIS